MAKTFVMAMTITMAKITSAAGKITVTLCKHLTLNEIHETLGDRQSGTNVLS